VGKGHKLGEGVRRQLTPLPVGEPINLRAGLLIGPPLEVVAFAELAHRRRLSQRLDRRPTASVGAARWSAQPQLPLLSLVVGASGARLVEAAPPGPGQSCRTSTSSPGDGRPRNRVCWWSSPGWPAWPGPSPGGRPRTTPDCQRLRYRRQRVGAAGYGCRRSWRLGRRSNAEAVLRHAPVAARQAADRPAWDRVVQWAGAPLVESRAGAVVVELLAAAGGAVGSGLGAVLCVPAGGLSRRCVLRLGICCVIRAPRGPEVTTCRWQKAFTG
jgi:hypothetical protein